MTGNTDTNAKLRALVLAFVMVMSVAVMNVGFVGTASAANLSDMDADAQLDSGATFWQGQDLALEGSGSISAKHGGSPISLTGGDAVQIRAVNTDNELAGLQSEFQLNTQSGYSGTKNVSTDDLDASDYVVTDGSNSSSAIRISSSGQMDEYGASQNTGTVGNYKFEIAIQNLDAEPDEDEDASITNTENSTIALTSNRGSYWVNISSPSLDEDELATLFDTPDNNVLTGNGNNPDSTSDGDDDDSVLVKASDDSTVVANFNSDVRGLDETGTFEFNFAVNDSTAESSTSIEVTEEDVGLTLNQSRYVENVGDIVRFTVSMEDTDNATIMIGGEDANYLEKLNVEDDDDDGEVTIAMNPHNVANSGTSSTGDVHGGDAYEVLGDDVIGSGFGSGINRTVGTDFPSENIDISSSLSDPLLEEEYDIIASSSGNVEASDDELSFPDEEDIASLSLNARSTDSATAWTAPRDNANTYDNYEEVTADATRADDVAINDQVIISVKASGIYGYVENENLSSVLGQGVTDGADTPNFAPTGGTGSIGDVNRDGLNFSITQANAGGNRDAKEFDLVNESSTDAHLYTDANNDTFYVVVDTRNVALGDDGSAGGARSFEDGNQFEAEFRIGEADNDNSPNPYVDDEEEESVTSQTFTMRDEDADFNNLVDEELQLSSGSNVSVTGTTNVAPNDEVAIRLRTTGDNAFFRENDVVVQDDGSWSTEFDLSDVAVGTNFTATVRLGGSAISDEVDGKIVGQPQASVTFEDGESRGGNTVTVQSVTMNRGGFVAIHQSSASGPVIGSSKYLSAGTHENVKVPIDDEITGTNTLVAMPHQDTNNNQVYDFPGADAPYTADGAPVTDSAVIQVTEATARPSPTPEFIPITETVIRTQVRTVVRTEVRTVERTVERTVVRTVKVTPTPGQPGFGIAVAIVALLAAAMLALRRRD